ncbi:MAG: LruC domain-containing protein [Prevotella sp.]|nr:LruC domain-containing protein [Prevotella sp.]
MLVFTHSQDTDGETIQSVSVLNEAELQGSTTVTLNYDAPSANDGLYVAFVSDKDYAIRKIENGTASLENVKRNVKRALPEGLVLPEGTFTLAEAIPSYAADRGWVPGEQLYGMSAESYENMKMDPVAYDKAMMTDIKNMVMSYFVDKKENLPLVKSSGMYNEKCYPITTGDDPIIVSPFYKYDGGSRYGSEVYNADLYYYYFKEEDLGSDPVAYLKSLPKYKAIPFNQCYTKDENEVLDKRCTYALLYWGEGTPDINETVGSFTFPKGLKIGFMVRSKATYKERGLGKDGEFYLDGRLNEHINSYGMLGVAKMKLKDGDPRGSWLTINDHLLICFETGADTDYNDLLMEVEGGIEGIIAIPEPKLNVYSYCFEDTKDGDYDMNDIVIKATRKSDTQVEYSIIACGGWDELYVKGINTGKIMDDKEIHGLFGLTTTEQFVNTEANAPKLSPITVTKTVDKSFSLTDPQTQPYIYNKTKNLEIRIAKQGENPYGIMIPNDFKYPLEKICIKDAYLEFNNWGQNPVLSTDWYTKPQLDKVYNK